MPIQPRQSEPARKLPWSYWPIMFVGCFLAALVGATVAITIGANPYIGFMVGWGLLVLHEVYVLKRKGY